jgi:hypothetical protein
MEDQRVWGCKYEGVTFDCGDKLGFLLANAAYGLMRQDLGPAFRAGLEKLLLRHWAAVALAYVNPGETAGALVARKRAAA